MREALPGMVSQIFLSASQISSFRRTRRRQYSFNLRHFWHNCMDSLRVEANKVIDVPTQGTSSSQAATQTTEESTTSLGMASYEPTILGICSHIWPHHRIKSSIGAKDIKYRWSIGWKGITDTQAHWWTSYSVGGRR